MWNPQPRHSKNGLSDKLDWSGKQDSQTKIRRFYFYTLLFILCILSFSSYFIVNNFWAGVRLINEPLHSTIEAVGATTALAMTGILLLRKKEKYGGKLFLVAMGFLSMGILEGFHAVAKPGNSFS